MTTVLTCLTGFGIFQHGGFGNPHMLGIVTLVVLAIAYVAGDDAGVRERGRATSRSLGYSLTFFFHWIPGVTETSSRLPPGAPLTTGPDDPRVQAAVGVGVRAVPDRRDLAVPAHSGRDHVVARQAATARTDVRPDRDILRRRRTRQLAL